MYLPGILINRLIYFHVCQIVESRRLSIPISTGMPMVEFLFVSATPEELNKSEIVLKLIQCY